jgi:hypothetical protein
MTYTVTILIAVIISVIVVTAAMIVLQPFTATTPHSCHETNIFSSNNDHR